MGTLVREKGKPVVGEVVQHKGRYYSVVSLERGEGQARQSARRMDGSYRWFNVRGVWVVAEPFSHD